VFEMLKKNFLMIHTVNRRTVFNQQFRNVHKALSRSAVQWRRSVIVREIHVRTRRQKNHRRIPIPAIEKWCAPLKSNPVKVRS
jgi:hypothetical protein